MVQQNRFPEAVVCANSTAATLALSTSYPILKGELAYATDTKVAYVGMDPATGGSFRPLATVLPYVAKTANYTLLQNDYTVDCTSGTFTITLPTAVGVTGQIYVVKNSGVGIITVNTTSSQTIDGLLTQTVNAGSAMMVQSNGSNWIVI